MTVTGTGWSFPTLFGASLARATTDIVLPQDAPTPPRTLIGR